MLIKDLGRLFPTENSRQKKRYGIFKCEDCGIEEKVQIRKNNFIGYRCASCLSRNLFTTHGYRNTRLYSIWKNMRNRCYYKQHKRYDDWGGRGITVCDEWKYSFVAFKDWALCNGYCENLSIDRIDNNKNYTPDNCRWATNSEQSMNRRKRINKNDYSKKTT